MISTSLMRIAAAIVLVVGVAANASPPGLPEARPDEVGIDAKKLAAIDRAVEASLAQRQMPGCVVLLVRHGKIALQRAYGHRQVAAPAGLRMTLDTVFDLASLTKPVATATSIMILGRVGVDRHRGHGGGHNSSPSSPATGNRPDHPSATIDPYQGGLVADNPLERLPRTGHGQAWKRILRPQSPSLRPVRQFIYSDVGYSCSARSVRRVSRKDAPRLSAANTSSSR